MYCNNFIYFCTCYSYKAKRKIKHAKFKQDFVVCDGVAGVFHFFLTATALTFTFDFYSSGASFSVIRPTAGFAWPAEAIVVSSIFSLEAHAGWLSCGTMRHI